MKHLCGLEKFHHLMKNPQERKGGEVNGILLQLSWELKLEGIYETLKMVVRKKDRQACERQAVGFCMADSKFLE